ncbi:hypothetical protein BaRGS_00011489 [Batillaria attramentaria]|uniref:Uncharacterized protein n=1 Tax=Batillaria attramentaria TaxID=370345 RepID=A0ABD0LCS9_9CAEN
MRVLLMLVLALCLTIAASAPTTESQCIPHNEECDPEVTGSRWNPGGTIRCCWSYEACMGWALDDGTTVHRCTPILPG